MYCMAKQKTRINTAFTQLKSVRVSHAILADIPAGVSFSDFVSEALADLIAKLRKTKASK